MLIVRFRETFRERFTEWALAAGLTGWGAILMGDEPIFDRAYYAPLRHMADQHVWAWAAFLIGLMRLVVLFINGAWWRTPQFRQAGSIFGLLVWAALLFGSLSSELKYPGTAIYTMIFTLEALCLCFAAADGKAAQCKRQRTGASAHGGG